jgi:spore germination protein KC
MANRIRILLLIFLLLLIPSGCWDRRETEQLLLVDALVFDTAMIDNSEQYKVTLIASKPSPGGGGQMGMGGEGGAPQGAMQWTASAYGQTLDEAMLKFSARAPRYLYLDHSRIVIFGEALARKGVSEAIDFLVRSRATRLRNFILIFKGNEAGLLTAKPEFEADLARELFAILEASVREGDYFHPNDLNIVAQDILTTGQDPWAPVIEIFTPAHGNQENTGQAVSIKGTALFKADKLAGFLNEEETQSFLMLKRLANTGIYFLDINGEKVSYKYEQAKVKRKLTLENSKVNVDYDITLQGLIEEVHFYTELTEDEIDKLEKMLANKAQNSLAKVIDRCHELGSDALGIGRFIHAKEPKIWSQYGKDWAKIYPEMNINVKVNVKITGTALGSKPIVPE